MLPMTQPPLQFSRRWTISWIASSRRKTALKRIALIGERQFLLDRIEQLPALLHVPVQHREAQVLPVAELMEERTLGHLSGAQDLFELRVVIPFQREQVGRRLEDLLSCLKRPRLRDGFHRLSHKTGRLVYYFGHPEVRWSRDVERMTACVKTPLAFCLCMASGITVSAAEFKVAGIFADGMVLERGEGSRMGLGLAGSQSHRRVRGPEAVRHRCRRW